MQDTVPRLGDVGPGGVWAWFVNVISFLGAWRLFHRYVMFVCPSVKVPLGLCAAG